MTTHTNGINGVHVNGGITRSLKPGIYAPIPTFFDSETEDLDISSFQKHVLHLASAGVLPLISGSMGEAHHLTPSERSTLIKAARSALDSHSLSHIPIIAGTGAGSTRETIQLCKEAYEAGADAVIVICSGYYAGALAKDRAALKAFWKEVSGKSTLPVIIYNYPGAAGGIDLDASLIIELARECPNICGVKLTCASIQKLTLVAGVTSQSSFVSQYPRSKPGVCPEFLVLGGFADFLLPAASVGGSGAITGLGNVSPHAIVKLFNISSVASLLSSPSSLQEARQLQTIIARGDATISAASIAGTKFLLEKIHGYGGNPRRPLPPIEKEKGVKLWEHEDVKDLIAAETKLASEARLGKVKGA